MFELRGEIHDIECTVKYNVHEYTLKYIKKIILTK